MTRHGTVLPIPDPRPQSIQSHIDEWPDYYIPNLRWPRSVWLGQMEEILRHLFPASSSRDRNLTARSLAPFPLAERDWL